jgi:hypothetical protein
LDCEAALSFLKLESLSFKNFDRSFVKIGGGRLSTVEDYPQNNGTFARAMTFARVIVCALLIACCQGSAAPRVAIYISTHPESQNLADAGAEASTLRQRAPQINAGTPLAIADVHNSRSELLTVTTLHLRREPVTPEEMSLREIRHHGVLMEHVNATSPALAPGPGGEMAVLQAMQQTMNDIQQRLVRLEGIPQTLAAVQASVAEVQASVVAVQATVAEVQASVAEVQASVVAVQATVTEVQASVAEMQTSVAEMQGSVAAVQASVAALQATVAEVRAGLPNESI